MKTIQRFVHWLCASQTNKKIPDPPSPENTVQQPTQAAPEPRPVSFADDDSPPGYKIRWHH